jgi:hypothetical protein
MSTHEYKVEYQLRPNNARDKAGQNCHATMVETYHAQDACSGSNERQAHTLKPKNGEIANSSPGMIGTGTSIGSVNQLPP